MESGFIQREIHESAYQAQQAVDSGDATVVGVNRFTTADKSPIEAQHVDPAMQAQQVERVRKVRSSRDKTRWRRALDEVRSAAAGSVNLVPPIIAAAEAHATVGEIADTLRDVFGEHNES